MNKQEVMARFSISSELYDEMEKWALERAEEISANDDPIERDINTDGAREGFEGEFQGQAPQIHYGDLWKLYDYFVYGGGLRPIS